MDYENFLNLAKKRRSCWEFKSDPVPEDSIEKIVDVARYAPSGFNSQPWNFLVIRDQELRDTIVNFISGSNLPSGISSPGPFQMQPRPGKKDPMGFKAAPVFILVCGDTRVKSFGPPGLRKDSKKFMEILISSLAISLQYMHLAAASMGFATRWVSAVARPDIEPEIKKLFNIPEEFIVYEMMALGYSDFQPPPKKMRPLSEVLHFDKYCKKDFRTTEELKQYFTKK